MNELHVRYTGTGLWVEKNDTFYRVGLSPKGQGDVGDVLFVDLPTGEEPLEEGSLLLSVEGDKAVTEFNIPFTLNEVEWHLDLEDHPEKLNNSQKEKNWIVSGVSSEGGFFERLEIDEKMIDNE